MAEADQSAGTSSEKAKRREARAIVGAYHQEQLRALLETERDAGLNGRPDLDAGGDGRRRAQPVYAELHAEYERSDRRHDP